MSSGKASAERDFGDSAGYGGGGSALDRDAVGDTGGKTRRPNPLDEVMRPVAEQGAGNQEGQAPVPADGQRAD